MIFLVRDARFHNKRTMKIGWWTIHRKSWSHLNVISILFLTGWSSFFFFFFMQLNSFGLVLCSEKMKSVRVLITALLEVREVCDRCFIRIQGNTYCTSEWVNKWGWSFFTSTRMHWHAYTDTNLRCLPLLSKICLNHFQSILCAWLRYRLTHHLDSRRGTFRIVIFPAVSVSLLEIGNTKDIYQWNMSSGLSLDFSWASLKINNGVSRFTHLDGAFFSRFPLTALFFSLFLLPVLFRDVLYGKCICTKKGKH